MRWVQKCYEDIMGDEKTDLEGKVKHLQDQLNFIISFTKSNGENHQDGQQNYQGETLQQQKKTVTSPFNVEPAGTEQHQSTLDGKKTTEQIYVGAAERIYTMRLPRPNKSIEKGL